MFANGDKPVSNRGLLAGHSRASVVNGRGQPLSHQGAVAGTPVVGGASTSPVDPPLRTAEHPKPAPPPAASVAGRFTRAERDAVYRRSLASADVLAATAALALATALSGNPQRYVMIIAEVPLIALMGNVIGIYHRDGLLVRKSTLDEAPALFQLATCFSLVVWLLDGLVIRAERDLWGLALLWLVLFLLLVILRAAARLLAGHFTPPERCLVIGAAGTCDWIRSKFDRAQALHAVVVGRVVADALQSQPAGVPEPLSDEGLRALVSELRVHRIIITPERADDAAVVSLVHAATSLGLKVSVLPRIFEVVGSTTEFDDLDGVPLLSMPPLGLRRSARLAKRALDMVGAALGLVLLSPLLAVIAAAIKIDSGGPVFFRQHRVGRGGRTFEMLKFRTMATGAEEQKNGLRHLNEADGLFKIADDPRITRVGRLLRCMSLDELPQLVNVICGEMSLVGPRPLVADEDSRIEGWHRRRLDLTPGMTGHWQILGSARVPLDEMARIDYLYATNWSLWLDLKILLRTVPYVLAGKGL